MTKTQSLYDGKVEIVRYDAEHVYKIAKSEFGHPVGQEIPYVPNVTRVLGVIDKPLLIQWAANETVKALRIPQAYRDYLEADYKTRGPLPAEIAEKLMTVSVRQLHEARVAHKNKKETAGAIGKGTHQYIEKLLNAWKPATTGAFYGLCSGGMGLKEIQRSFGSGVISFALWCKDHPRYSILSWEQLCFSVGLFYVGTFDLILQMGAGDPIVVDFKTSNGVYPEMILQVSAYSAAKYEETGLPHGRGLLHLHKDGSIANLYEYPPEDFEKGGKDFAGFINCLGLSGWQEWRKSTAF